MVLFPDSPAPENVQYTVYQLNNSKKKFIKKYEHRYNARVDQVSLFKFKGPFFETFAIFMTLVSGIQLYYIRLTVNKALTKHVLYLTTAYFSRIRMCTFKKI